MRWLWRLLCWAFPSSLFVLLPIARRHGSIAFVEVAGVGWQCTIRPPTTGPWQRGAVNAWSAMGKSLSDALENAIIEAQRKPLVALDIAKMAPKLGGAEFDEE